MGFRGSADAVKIFARSNVYIYMHSSTEHCIAFISQKGPVTQKRSSIPVLFFSHPTHFVYYCCSCSKTSTGSLLQTLFHTCLPHQIPKSVDIFLLYIRVEGDRPEGLRRLSIVHESLAELVRVSGAEKEAPWVEGTV